MTQPPPDLETRISELATGFALGDLDENELRELYDLLRVEGSAGAQAARVAWQTLGMVTDLRSQVSSSFQDTLTHKLSQEASRNGGFTSRLLSRLGFRAPTLSPVEAPQPPAQFRFALWLMVALITGALIAGVIALIWTQSTRTRAVVTNLHGSASIGGQALTPGSEVDHRSIVVKAGGRLTLAWDDGSTATLTSGEYNSEAVATIRPHGLALLRGQANIYGRVGFKITLPDRSGDIAQDDTQIAAEVFDQRGFFGVVRGQLTDSKFSQSLFDNDGTSPRGPFRWQWSWDAQSGTLTSGDDSPPDWIFNGTIAWGNLNDTARIICASTTPIEIKAIPGQIVVLVDDVEQQRLILPGSPLLATPLLIRQQDCSTLLIQVGDRGLTIPLTTSITGYRIQTSGKAQIHTSAFHPLPTPHKK